MCLIGPFASPNEHEKWKSNLLFLDGNIFLNASKGFTSFSWASLRCFHVATPFSIYSKFIHLTHFDPHQLQKTITSPFDGQEDTIKKINIFPTSPPKTYNATFYLLSVSFVLTYLEIFFLTLQVWCLFLWCTLID